MKPRGAKILARRPDDGVQDDQARQAIAKNNRGDALQRINGALQAISKIQAAKNVRILP